MRFKLLHVRPHVWFFKRQETIKATSDDSSSTEGPFVYKRSTSLRLVKSVDNRNGLSNSLDVKPALKDTPLSARQIRQQGKNVQVCTVVDTGCTCRATVASQHTQKKGSSVSSRDVGSMHDMCRPRRTQDLEVKADKDNAGTLKDECLHSKSTLSMFSASERKRSMVSRLVCKSSHDVMMHSQLNPEQRHVTCTLSHGKDPQHSACTSHVRDSKMSAVQLDVHELECRLRNAGLEERRRVCRKQNKLYYEEGSLTSSGISSLGTSVNTDTVLTTTTSEVQDIPLSMNVNPTFDLDVLSTTDRLMSLEDLRASIAARKLANPSPRSSLCAENGGLLEGVMETVSFCSSPSPFSTENLKYTNGTSNESQQNINDDIQIEKRKVSVKHVDVGATKKKVFGFESDDAATHEGLVKQTHQISSDNTSSKLKDTRRNYEGASQKAARRIDLGTRRNADAHHNGNGKTRVIKPNSSSTQGERHSLNRFKVGGSARAGTNPHEADSRGTNLDDLTHMRGTPGYRQGDIGQEKQVTSSSSCEIQVLSDCNPWKQSDSASHYPMLRIHVGGSPYTSNVASMEAHTSENELISSEGAVAMVKSSYNPGHDFKESMLEMVVAKRLQAPQQLQQLLECYLSLNSVQYHPIIIKVFHELCTELLN